MLQLENSNSNSSKKLKFSIKNNEFQHGRIEFVHDTPSTNTSFVSELKKLTGIENNDLLMELISSAGAGMPRKDDLAHSLNVSAQVLAESNPKDINETRLALQANSLFSQGMHYLNKANNSEMLCQSEFYMKSAIKLLRLHNETIETLHRYRRKGEQTVTVQHVNVNAGGQAIVGNLKTGGG